MLRSQSNNNECKALVPVAQQKVAILLQFTPDNCHFPICCGEMLLLVWGSQGRGDTTWLSNLTLFVGAALEGEKIQLFASRLNCSTGETTAVVTPGNACREQEVVGNGAVVQGSVQGRAHQPLFVFVQEFKCLKKHGNSANPYGFHTRRRDATIKA